MKVKQLSNLKRSLERTREQLNVSLNGIERVLKEIQELQYTNEKICPQCFSRDVRIMRKGRIFCRACGYPDTRKEVEE